MQDQWARRRGQRLPVDIAPNIGHGVRRPQWQARIRGHRGGVGQARHDLEIQVCFRQRRHLGDHRVHRKRVPGHQSHDVDPGARLGRQRLGDLGRITQRGPDVRATWAHTQVGENHRRRRRHADGGIGMRIAVRGGLRGLSDLRGGRFGSRRRRQLGTRQGEYGFGHVGIGEHQGGVGQHGAGPRRQQTGVTRARTDERDAARLRLTPSRRHLSLTSNCSRDPP